MHLEDRLQICLLAVASRYPDAYVEINEKIPGFDNTKNACWKTLDLLDLLQNVSPDVLQSMSHLEIDAQKCVIYLLDRSSDVPTLMIYVQGKFPVTSSPRQPVQPEVSTGTVQANTAPLFKHILVPLDGSKLAELALPIASRIAHASGGTIILMRAVSPSLMSTRYASGTIEIARRNASQYLDTVKQVDLLAHVPVTVEVCVGPPGEMIVAAARLHQSDLIVLCSHGESGFKRWTLGSVAQKLSRSSTIPLLVLQDDRTTQKMASAIDFSFRIMVALDGSPLAEEVIPVAANLSSTLSAPATGTLRLVRILHLPSSFEYGQDDSVAQALREETPEAEAYLQQVKERLQTGELAGLRLHVTTGVDHDLNIADMLLQVAQSAQDEANACDIIALATHGRSGIKRWLLGSVAERIANSTQFPVLIMRPERDQVDDRTTRSQKKQVEPSARSSLS